MSFNRQDLIRDLRALGLQSGDVVLFHSSLRSIGYVEGGASTVIEAFLETVGVQGTVAVPTIIYTSNLPREPFDVEKSPSEVGIISETLRKHPAAVRSVHPTTSLAAIGHRAHELVEGHEHADGLQSPWGKQAFGKGSPWDLLYRWNARCLLLGVSFEVCTLLHCGQMQYLEKHQRNFEESIPFPYLSHEKMGEILKEQLQLKPGRVGQAQSWLLNAHDIVEHTVAALESCPAWLAIDDHPVSFLAWTKKHHRHS